MSGEATTPLPESVTARTVPELLQAAVAAAPQRIATVAHSLIEGGETAVTYAEIAERSARLASVLGDRGVGPGDRVAIIVGNAGALEAQTTYHAVHRLGAINVPINTFYVEREFEFAIGAIDPAAIVFDSQYADALGRAGSAEGQTVHLEIGSSPQLGESFQAVLEAASQQAPAASVEETDDADWLFTSGTVGHAKTVALTHANTVACGHEAQIVWGLDADSIFQNSSPFFTSTGCHTNLQACLAAACTFVVDPEVDAAAIVERANRHGTTSMMTLTAILAILLRRLDDGRLSSLEIPSLRRLIYGGQTMPRAFHERLEHHFTDGHGTELGVIYGLTEGGTSGIWLTPADHAEAVRRHGSYGMSIGRDSWNDWVDYRIVGEDGDAVGPDQVGEIQLRSPSVMSRYVGDEAATEEALRDGWLHTGDMATIDDQGFVYFVDRSKSMIRRGGMNIAALEVEGVVMSHPAIEEAAVIGKPNPVLGEDVHLIAVLTDEGEASAEELIEFCQERLAEYKVPRSVSFLDQLPRNAMNKVSRGELTADS